LLISLYRTFYLSCLLLGILLTVIDGVQAASPAGARGAPALSRDQGITSQSESSFVLTLTFRGAVTPVLRQYLSGAIEDAQAEGAEAVILRLDTPGGSVEVTKQIVQDMLASPVPVVVYVAPSAAQAGSAGTVFHGRSFGAALAIMAQAVAPRADYLVAAVPTLGWADGRRRLATGGSTLEVNEHLAQRPSAEAAAMRTLAYFDTVNYADCIACDALVGVGLHDTIVPPASVYAIVNHMRRRPEVMELPVSHTELLEERHWVEFDRRWTSRVAGLAATR
jgi:hypothetical protein